MLSSQNSRNTDKRALRRRKNLAHGVQFLPLFTAPLCTQARGRTCSCKSSPGPQPSQFLRELKAQRAAWIHSKDCEPLNSLSAQLQQASFKQSSAAVGMENLAVNSAKSSYLSPSERHQLRKKAVSMMFSLYSNTFLTSLCPHFSPCIPVWAQKGNGFAERRGQCICIVEEILIVQEAPHASEQINWH